MLKGTMWIQVKDQTSEMPLSLALHRSSNIPLQWSLYLHQNINIQRNIWAIKGTLACIAVCLTDWTTALWWRQCRRATRLAEASRQLIVVMWFTLVAEVCLAECNKKKKKLKTFPFALVTSLEANDTKMSFLFAWTLLCILVCCDIGECRRRNVLLIIGV